MFPQPIAPLRIVMACATEDGAACRAIAQRLRRDGFDLWLISDEGGAQADQLRPLRNAVAAADAVIFCFSRRTLDTAGQLAPDVVRLLDLLRFRPVAVGLAIVLRLGVCDVPPVMAQASVFDLFGYSGYTQLLAALNHYAGQHSSESTPPPPSIPVATTPPNPALTLCGRYALESLGQQGHARRLGRGCPRSLLLLANERLLLITGGGVALFDYHDPKPLWALDCPTRYAVLSPSGRLLAIARNTQVTLWDLQVPQVRHHLAGDGSPISALAFSPDERTLATASAEQGLRLWRTGDEPATLASPLFASMTQHPDQIRSMAFSPDGTLLVTGGADRSVRIWRTFDRSLVQTLTGHGGGIECIAFSPDGTILAVGSRGRSIRLWAIHDWRLLQTLEGHSGAVECIAFSPEGTLIASGASDHSLHIWQVANGNLQQRFTEHHHPLIGVSFSPDAQQIASIDAANQLVIRHVADGRVIATLQPASSHVTSLAFSPDGEQLAVGSSDGTLLVHNLYGGPSPFCHYHDQQTSVTSLTFSDDGKRLMSTSGDHRLWLYQPGQGASGLCLQTSSSAQGALVAPGGRLLAHSDGAGTVQIWRLNAGRGQFWQVLRGLHGRPQLLRFSPLATMIAVVSADGTLQLWRIDMLDTPATSPQLTIAGVTGRIRTLAFSPDETQVATGSDTGSLQIWEVAHGNLWATMGDHGAAAVGIAFAPQGNTIAVGYADGEICIWPLGTASRGKARPRRRTHNTSIRISGHAGAVEQLAYNPSGDLLASGSADGTVRLWQVLD